MFDIHLHILANVDDGPSDRSDSASMIRLARSLGYENLVATPHLHEPLPAWYEERIAEERAWLSEEAAASDIELRFGFEVRLTPGVGDRLASGEPISLAGSHTVLVELPFVGWPVFTDQALTDIFDAGFRPLLAHPERYAAALDEPALVYGLRERGVLLQITTGSLAGLFGNRSKALAVQLLQDGAVDVLASDAHSAGRRYVSVTEGLAYAEQLVGPERVRQLTTDNPRALLGDQELDPPVPTEVRSNVGRNGRRHPGRARQLIPRR